MKKGSKFCYLWVVNNFPSPCHCHQTTTGKTCSKLTKIFVFSGVIYGFKGLILVFGLFLAYETRSIKVKQINDSRYVGMSIYNIAVLCLITAPVAMVIASQQDASFAFVALAVIFCCFLSMLLIFVPKVISQFFQFSYSLVGGDLLTNLIAIFMKITR